MALKPIYDLNTTDVVKENSDILVYQGNKLKKLKSDDVFVSKDYIDKTIVEQKNDIVEALSKLHANVNEQSTLIDAVNAIDDIDLFEIGTRRLVHNGTNTYDESYGYSSYDAATGKYTYSQSRNPQVIGTGIAQTVTELDRVYKVGDCMTIIPKISYNQRNPETDFIYADYSSSYGGLKRNDFYGGEYAINGSRWSNGIYPWNKMKPVQILENEDGTTSYNYDIGTGKNLIDGLNGTYTDYWYQRDDLQQYLARLEKGKTYILSMDITGDLGRNPDWVGRIIIYKSDDTNIIYQRIYPNTPFTWNIDSFDNKKIFFYGILKNDPSESITFSNVQLEEGNIRTEYDSYGIDNGGNYFTEVPLYFIKTQILTEDNIDITSSWPYIPKEYITKNIYEYNFVCKSMLDGYRPASFFLSKENNIDFIEDSNGEYIYLQNLDCYHKPKVYGNNTRYSKIPSSNTDYYTILDNVHYFACYESSSNEVSSNRSVVCSRPSIFNYILNWNLSGMPKASTSLDTFRTMTRNIDPLFKSGGKQSSPYYIKDMRSHTDFFTILMDIEFANTCHKLFCTGVDNFPYRNMIVESLTNNTVTVAGDINYSPGMRFTVGSSSYPFESPATRIITMVTHDDGGYTTLEFIGEPVTPNGSQSYLWTQKVACGLTNSRVPHYFREDPNGYYKHTENLKFELIGNNESYIGTRYSPVFKVNNPSVYGTRSLIANGKDDTIHAPFRWNWIENPYGNSRKFIDGCKVKIEKDINDNLYKNKMFICDNPDLYYSNRTTDFGENNAYKPIHYILKSEILNNSIDKVRTTGSMYSTQVGYDIRYPYARFSVGTSGTSTSGVAGYFYDSTAYAQSDTARCVLTSGYYSEPNQCSIRYFYTGTGLANSDWSMCTSFERKEG